MAQYHKRKFTPTQPQKYAGDHSNIIMRSSWETRFALWCDQNPAVVKWSSEETVVPYVCPTDMRPHRYFIDFKIQLKQRDGSLKTYLVEIKPNKQTQPPVAPQRKTKRYLVECATYLKNQAKWEAAKRFAADRGWEFIVLDEYALGIK